MQILQDLINGSRYISNSAHLNSESFLRSKEYKVIVPGKVEEAPRNLLTDFYQADNMFSLKPETLKQLTTVYKTEENPFGVVFAASFFIVEISNTIVAFIEIIKTAERAKGQRLGSTFIKHIKEYIQKELNSDSKYESAVFLVG